MDAEDGTMEEAWGAEEVSRKDKEPAECIVDVREYDINYYLRVAIDLGECSAKPFMRYHLS
jgi:DNA polymerase epsilon subunit 1